MFMPWLELHHSSAGKTPPTPPPTGNPRHHGLAWKPVPGMAVVQDAKPKKKKKSKMLPKLMEGAQEGGSAGCDCVSICECAFICWKVGRHRMAAHGERMKSCVRAATKWANSVSRLCFFFYLTHWISRAFWIYILRWMTQTPESMSEWRWMCW